MTDPIKKIYRKAKGVLFTDPEILYKEERHLVNQPFYFPGTNGKGVLLIHGWSSVPYEVRRLGKYLNENGYTVSGPMLRGHGTVPKDLEDVKWEDWLEDVERAYQELKESCSSVYVGGTSIGGNLTVLLAAQYPGIAGVILMATPYKIRLEKLALVFAKILRKIKRYSKKFYPPTFGASNTLTRTISYQTYPVDSAIETFHCIINSRRFFPKVIQPCYILQSSSDHIVASGNMEKIFEAVGSKNKTKKYIHRAYHTFISDIRNEHVFQDILNFLKEN